MQSVVKILYHLFYLQSNFIKAFGV